MPEKTFAGGDDAAGLREWAETMKERAGYGSEELQMARQKAERAPDEITDIKLMEWHIEEEEELYAWHCKIGRRAQQRFMSKIIEPPIQDGAASSIGET